MSDEAVAPRPIGRERAAAFAASGGCSSAGCCLCGRGRRPGGCRAVRRLRRRTGTLWRAVTLRPIGRESGAGFAVSGGYRPGAVACAGGGDLPAGVREVWRWAETLGRGHRSAADRRGTGGAPRRVRPMPAGAVACAARGMSGGPRALATGRGFPAGPSRCDRPAADARHASQRSRDAAGRAAAIAADGSPAAARRSERQGDGRGGSGKAVTLRRIGGERGAGFAALVGYPGGRGLRGKGRSPGDVGGLTGPAAGRDSRARPSLCGRQARVARHALQPPADTRAGPWPLRPVAKPAGCRPVRRVRRLAERLRRGRRRWIGARSGLGCGHRRTPQAGPCRRGSARPAGRVLAGAAAPAAGPRSRARSPGGGAPRNGGAPRILLRRPPGSLGMGGCGEARKGAAPQAPARGRGARRARSSPAEPHRGRGMRRKGPGAGERQGAVAAGGGTGAAWPSPTRGDGMAAGFAGSVRNGREVGPSSCAAVMFEGCRAARRHPWPQIGRRRSSALGRGRAGRRLFAGGGRSRKSRRGAFRAAWRPAPPSKRAR